ncbi:hypothetical protein PC117_g2432 [Phytophthora cactorum]|uniref:Uncharacterized protein n=1 Tax=Phytophthora cactorum TaxID=29920 RepID=A0A8T1EH26_9STRA|nr:hypothetical protein PC117_g2432 [Phytophthora cactorum]
MFDAGQWRSLETTQLPDSTRYSLVVILTVLGGSYIVGIDQILIIKRNVQWWRTQRAIRIDNGVWIKQEAFGRLYP